MCETLLQVKHESHTLKPLKMHTYILITHKCFILWTIMFPVLFSLFCLPATSGLIHLLKCIADFEMRLQQGWKDFGKPVLPLDQKWMPDDVLEEISEGTRPLRVGETINLRPYCHSRLNTEHLQPAFKQEFSLGCKQAIMVHSDPTSHTLCCSELLCDVTETQHKTFLTVLNLMNSVHRTFLTAGHKVPSQKSRGNPY